MAPNGLNMLPAALAAHMPLDLVIIALGTNDFKDQYDRLILDIAKDIIHLGEIASINTGVKTIYGPPKVLILCPPPLGFVHPEEPINTMFSKASLEKSQELSGVLAPLVASAGFDFFDTGTILQTSGPDGVHLTAENHKLLGDVMGRLVKKLL